MNTALRCTTDAAAAGSGLARETAKDLRRKTSGAVGSSLDTTIKYLNGAVGFGLGIMVKYLRKADTSGSCLSQVLDCGAEAVARGAARCASHVLDRGPQAGGQAVYCGDATLSQQEKGTRQMSRRT
jgi:hypothetical protein